MQKLLVSLIAAVFLFGCSATLNNSVSTNTDPSSIGESPDNSQEESSDERSEITVVSIVDTTKGKDIALAEALEGIFEDDKNIYYLPCIMSEYIIVEYDNGTSENVATALSSGRAKISDLDRFGIFYITEAKEHTHTPEESENVVEHEEIGYCGNTSTTVKYHGLNEGMEEWEYSFMGGVSVELTDTLRWFDYDDGVCDCIPEYTVTTEFGLDYKIDLAHGYVRYNGKQVNLTDEQTNHLKELMDKVYIGYVHGKMPGSKF